MKEHLCKVVYTIKLIFSPAPPHILPKDLQHLLDFQLNFPTSYIVSPRVKIGRTGYFLAATALALFRYSKPIYGYRWSSLLYRWLFTTVKMHYRTCRAGEQFNKV